MAPSTLGGTKVDVSARAKMVDHGRTLIKVFPTTEGVTQTGRETTDRIGGNKVFINRASTADVVSHEFGHVAGAGDQYVGGVGSDGRGVQREGPGQNIMQDLRGPANQSSLREILEAPTNKNSCARGVSAASGGC